MKILLLASIALSLSIGCDPVPESQTAAPAPKPVASESKSPASLAAEPPTQTEVTKQDPNSAENSNRIYQLSTLEKTTLRVARRKLECWVMDTVGKQQEGMMWLTEKDVRDEQGMIFVFADAQPQSFWMQNTLIPLDIIYIAEDGKVLNIEHGKVQDETSLPSEGPAKYVLELKEGMARRFGIRPGTRLDIPSNLKFKPNES
jgi:uncharacterized protein